MKLKELLNAINAEIDAVGIEPKGASVSLSFVARRGSGGEVECDFIDASEISKPREGEIHRLNVSVRKGAESELPTEGELRKAEKTPPSKPRAMKASAGGLFGGEDELDTPAIYRSRLATAPA